MYFDEDTGEFELDPVEKIQIICSLLPPFEFADAEFEKNLREREFRQGYLPNGDYYEGEFVKGTQIREGRGFYFNFSELYLY